LGIPLEALRPFLPAKFDQDKYEHVDHCYQCRQGGSLVCCDWCDAVWHAACVQPPLDEKTYREEEDFCCPVCTAEAESLYFQRHPLPSPRDLGGLDLSNDTPQFTPQPLRIVEERLCRDASNRIYMEYLVQFVEANGMVRPTLEWVHDSSVRHSKAFKYWLFSQRLADTAKPLAQATVHSSESVKPQLSSVALDVPIVSPGGLLSPAEDTLVVTTGTCKSKRLQNRVGNVIGMVLDVFPVL